MREKGFQVYGCNYNIKGRFLVSRFAGLRRARSSRAGEGGGAFDLAFLSEFVQSETSFFEKKWENITFCEKNKKIFGGRLDIDRKM